MLHSGGKNANKTAMQEVLPYNPSSPENFREILRQLLADCEHQAEKYRKILQYISTGANSFFNFSQLQTLFDAADISKKSCEEHNWAFIDMQNLHKSVQESGWKIQWNLFHEYLVNTHHVSKAVVFMGYLKRQEWFYEILGKSGFTLEFREVRELPDGIIDGGNCDADLSGYVMDHKYDYDQAIIIADDADYCRTLESLKRQGKLKTIISPHTFEGTSEQIKRTIGHNFISSIQDIREAIERKPYKR